MKHFRIKRLSQYLMESEEAAHSLLDQHNESSVCRGRESKNTKLNKLLKNRVFNFRKDGGYRRNALCEEDEIDRNIILQALRLSKKIKIDQLGII